MFSEKRPTTSRGPKSRGLTSDVVFKVCIFSFVFSSLVSLQNFTIRTTLGHWPASCAAFYCSSSPKDLQWLNPTQITRLLSVNYEWALTGSPALLVFSTRGYSTSPILLASSFPFFVNTMEELLPSIHLKKNLIAMPVSLTFVPYYTLVLSYCCAIILNPHKRTNYIIPFVMHHTINPRSR